MLVPLEGLRGERMLLRMRRTKMLLRMVNVMVGSDYGDDDDNDDKDIVKDGGECDGGQC